MGTGRFELEDDDEEDYLKLDAKYYENFGEPEFDHDKRAGDLEIDFKQKEKNFSFDFSSSTPEYFFVLGNNEITTDIDVNVGTGKGVIKLDSKAIKNLKANVSTGGLEISLSENALPTKEMVFDVGTGSMTLTIPEDIGYKVTYDVGIVGV